MTSIRVSVEGQGYTFPLGSSVRIGGASDADVVLDSPAISPYHARLFSNGTSWWLASEAGSDIWVAGERITSVSLAGPMSAWLGPRGEVAVRFEPAAARPPAEGQPGAGQPTVQQRQAAPPPAAAQPAPAQPPRGEQPIGDYWATTPLSRPPARGPQAPGPIPLPGDPTQAIPARPAPGQQAPGQLVPMPAPAPPIPVLSGTPMPGPGMLGGQTITGQDRMAVLVTRLGDVQRVFPIGIPVRVGRDPTLELISVNPLVSRGVHGVITSDQRGATYTDQSRRGTFHDGKKLRGPLRITESVVLRLGDPATGEELGITPPLSSSQMEHNRGQRVLRGRLRMVGAAALALVVVAGIGTYFLTKGTGKAAPAPTSAASGGLSGGTPEAVLQHTESATVRLLLGSQANYTGWGSGTVLSPTGLILTNAHVAEPQAPGAAVALGLPSSQLDPNPPFLTVEVTTGPANPVVAKYRAKPVAVDGYLDLAVVQIYATSNGTPVNPASLHLPYLTLGSDAKVQLDQPITVLGFPGVSDSDSITVTSGVISTFIPDPLQHVSDPRFMLETTARLAHGNSGGAAINNAGQLIGVPSLEVTGEGGDLSWRLRSVTEALPLITAARKHTTYHSRILVQPTGAERVASAGVGSSGDAACGGGRSIAAPAGAWFGAAYANVPKGLDLALEIGLPDGTAFAVPTGGLPQGTAPSSSGCIAYDLTPDQLGAGTLPSGTYQIQLFGGPSLTPIGQPTTVTVNTSGA